MLKRLYCILYEPNAISKLKQSLDIKVKCRNHDSDCDFES